LGVEAARSEIVSLWNLWDAYPEERKNIEGFLLEILKDADIDPETRANLIAGFAQISRRNLKPLFAEFYETFS
jgi:hypothetical protein